MANLTTIKLSQSELDNYLKDSKNLLQLFMSTFVEDNGYDHMSVKATLNNNVTTQTMWKNKMWSKTYTGQALIGLETDEFQIIFGEGSTTSIELYMIEVKNQSKGVGTRVINEMLDVADQFGINITCVPTPYKNVNDDHYCAFLRQWYASFGFSASPFSPTMTYKSK